MSYEQTTHFTDKKKTIVIKQDNNFRIPKLAEVLKGEKKNEESLVRRSRT